MTVSARGRILGGMSNLGEDLLESRRRRRRGGDPRITPEGRDTLRRFVTGDLMDQFQAGLDQDTKNDPALSGNEPLD